MFPIPYRKTKIVSPHSADMIVACLRVHTSRRWPWFRSPRAPFDFVGSVSPNTFRVIPTNRGGRYTYQPWSLGQVTPRPDGTEIKLVQTLHPIGILIIIACLIAALFLWARTEYFGGAAIFTAALFVLHAVLYYRGFWGQARRTEEQLRRIAT